MSPNVRNTWLLSLNLCLWSMNALIASGTINLFAKKTVPVMIETTPPRTRVSLNGNILRGPGVINGWIQTPAKIQLPPGQHKITVERNGYAPHAFKVLITEGDSNMTLKSDLQISSDANNEVTIEVLDQDLMTATIILDQGLEAQNAPIVARDLVPGMHILEIHPGNDDIQKKKPFVCTFNIPATGMASHKVTASLKNGRIQATNCQRLRKLP